MKKIVGIGLAIGLGSGITYLIYRATRSNAESPPPTGNSGLFVFVMDLSTGRGLSGATITLGSRQQVTGADGTLIFTGLAPGTYAVKVTATGYTTINTSQRILAGIPMQYSTFEMSH